MKRPVHLSLPLTNDLPGGLPNIPGGSDREVDYGLGCGGVNYPHFLGTCRWVVRSDVMFVTSGVWEAINEDGTTRHWRNGAVLVFNFSEGNLSKVFPAASNVGPLWIQSVERDVVRLTARDGCFLFDVRKLEYVREESINLGPTVGPSVSVRDGSPPSASGRGHRARRLTSQNERKRTTVDAPCFPFFAKVWVAGSNPAVRSTRRAIDLGFPCISISNTSSLVRCDLILETQRVGSNAGVSLGALPSLSRLSAPSAAGLA